MIARYLFGGAETEIDLTRDGDGWAVQVGDRSFRVDATDSGSGSLVLSIDGKRVRARVVADGSTRWVWIDGSTWRLEIPDPRAGRHEAGDVDDGAELNAPISGAVVAIEVAPGDPVAEGQVLVVVEAMKMEHRIRSPRAGIVGVVHCEVGAMVEQNMRLVDLEPEADEA